VNPAPDDLSQTSAASIDSARFRQVLGHFASGITIVTAIDGGQPVGMTAQSFSSVSLDPPLVAFFPGKSSTSYPRIQSAGVFCVNLLAEDQEALCRTFAVSGGDKFAGVGFRPAAGTGSPVLADALAWIDCRIETEHDAGDHIITVGRVLDLEVTREAKPLLFYRGGFGRFEA
jgi:flavin reductase (DIM6/NTAB) family NADH-FMN oxidoreductase RutF